MNSWVTPILLAILSVVVAVQIAALFNPEPACNPDWPVWQCNGSPETNAKECCK